MNSNAGASDKAKIEVIRGTPPAEANLVVGGVFDVECLNSVGECFYRESIKNALTLEWAKEMIQIFADGLPGDTDAFGGIDSIIGAMAFPATPTITYNDTVGTNAFAYFVQLSTTTVAADAAHTYGTTSPVIHTAPTAANFVDANRQKWGLLAQPHIIAGDANTTPAAGTTTWTATNQTFSGGSSVVDERAQWVRDATVATETIGSVSLVFTNNVTMGHTTAGTYNRLVARAVLGTPVGLQAGDTINVRYSVSLAAS